MNKDQVAGKIKDVAGGVRATVGRAIDSPTEVAKGKALEVEGKLQKAAGDIKEAVKDATKKP
ncbi:MAG: CsbD family protein [Comamonas sp.]